MARIGMKYLVFAPISAETEASGVTSLTYGAGVKADHARRGAITYNWDEASLYGDDKLAEYLKSATGADVEIETTELDTAVAVLLGLEKSKGSDVYTLATENTVNVGFGFIQVNIVNGVKSYRAFWFHKVTFSPDNEESNTKEETIDWGTPTITGKVWPVVLNLTLGAELRTYKDFESEAAAVSYLNGLANIT